MVDQNNAGEESPAKRMRFVNYDLLDPITSSKDDTKIDRLVIRRPRGKELREVEAITRDKGAVAASWYMIAALASITTDDVDSMDGEDVANVSNIIEGFMPAQKTGEQ